MLGIVHLNLDPNIKIDKEFELQRIYSTYEVCSNIGDEAQIQRTKIYSIDEPYFTNPITDLLKNPLRSHLYYNYAPIFGDIDDSTHSFYQNIISVHNFTNKEIYMTNANNKIITLEPHKIQKSSFNYPKKGVYVCYHGAKFQLNGHQVKSYDEIYSSTEEHPFSEEVEFSYQCFISNNKITNNKLFYMKEVNIMIGMNKEYIEDAIKRITGKNINYDIDNPLEIKKDNIKNIYKYAIAGHVIIINDPNNVLTSNIYYTYFNKHIDKIFVTKNHDIPPGIYVIDTPVNDKHTCPYTSHVSIFDLHTFQKTLNDTGFVAVQYNSKEECLVICSSYDELIAVINQYSTSITNNNVDRKSIIESEKIISYKKQIEKLKEQNEILKDKHTRLLETHKEYKEEMEKRNKLIKEEYERKIRELNEEIRLLKIKEKEYIKSQAEYYKAQSNEYSVKKAEVSYRETSFKSWGTIATAVAGVVAAVASYYLGKNK